MSMEFVNRICPNCKNPNYMVLLGDFSKAYKYKCLNCNGYFNDIEPIWKSEWMNTKIDMVEVVRCENCKHRSDEMYDYYGNPNDKVYVCQINDLAKKPEWFCADGERQ